MFFLHLENGSFYIFLSFTIFVILVIYFLVVIFKADLVNDELLDIGLCLSGSLDSF